MCHSIGSKRDLINIWGQNTTSKNICVDSEKMWDFKNKFYYLISICSLASRHSPLWFSISNLNSDHIKISKIFWILSLKFFHPFIQYVFNFVNCISKFDIKIEAYLICSLMSDVIRDEKKIFLRFTILYSSSQFNWKLFTCYFVPISLLMVRHAYRINYETFLLPKGHYRLLLMKPYELSKYRIFFCIFV
jgi:hypothetical protein